MKRGILTVLFLLILISPYSIAFSAPGIIIISPKGIDLSSSEGTFITTVLTEDIPDIAAFDFQITFDPAIVTIPAESDITLSQTLQDHSRTYTPLNLTIDNTTGRIRFSVYSYGSEPGPGGTVPLADITFTIQSRANSTLDLNNTILTDSNGRQYFDVLENDAEMVITHTITATAQTGGTINPAGEIQVIHGEDQTFAITPDAGYHISKLWIDGASTGSTASHTFSSVTADHTISADFARNTYDVVFETGPGGSLSGTTHQVVEHGKDAVAVEAVADEGYLFAGWTGDYTGTENPLTLTNVTASKTIQANFTVKTYTITFESGPGGTLSGDTTQVVEHGKDATVVQALPAEGYRFMGWTGDYTGTDNPLTLTQITAAQTIQANFAIKTYTIAFESGPGGTLTGSNHQIVEHGKDATPVQAVPDEGYVFTGWTGSYTGAENPLTITNAVASQTIQANFRIKTYNVAFETGAGGSLSGDLQQVVAHGSDAAAVQAVPNQGYLFTGWTGGHTGTENPLTLTNITASQTIRAEFTLKTYTITFESGAGGSLIGNSHQIVAHGSDAAAVQAVPDEGASFIGWTGDYTGTANPLNLTDITASKTIRANFSIMHYKVLFESGPCGSLSGETRQTVEHGGSTSPVTAQPDPGYEFTGWGGVYGIENPFTLTDITEDLTLTAAFAREGQTLSHAVAGLQILSGISPVEGNPEIRDVDGDSRIGFAEVIYILQTVSGIREAASCR